ncbi:MAG TPA: M1 family aminopeptidase [Kofleriaceae bacterium]|nr:M1 family aminopeptidase [Kofleriaceae bacterium]
MSPRVRSVFVCLVAACGSTARTSDHAALAPAPSATTAGAAAAPALDPPRPTLRLPRNFVPTAYRARLALDPAQDRFTGSIEIDGEIRERSRGLWLHGRGLQVTAAKAVRDGHPVRIDVAAADEDLLSLHLAEPLDPGRVTLALDYGGAFDLIEGVGAYKKAFDDAAYIETQFESIFARRVFPCVDEPDSKVPWQLTLDVPKDLVAVANTAATGESPLDGRTKRVVFAPTRPLPSYLIAFGVGPFEPVDAGKTRAGTPIRIIALRGRAREARWAADTTARIVQLLEDYFGTPYPYDKLDQIARPTVLGGAMENAGLITYGTRLILRDPAQITAGERYAWVNVAAHELAHQWFGDLVTTAWWDDIWLNEGFASWLGAKIVGQFDPAWRGELVDTASRETALAADSVISARRVRQPIQNAGDIFQAFDGITYNKGANILAMFERAIGPEKFRDGVRSYLAGHRFGNATSADFVAAISEVAGHDVAPAFSSFLDQAGAPVVRSELVCQAGAAPKLVLSQRRYVLPGSPAPPGGRPWRLPVCVAFDRGGARGEACTELTSATAELPLDTSSCPTWVFANAGGRGYYRSSQPEAQLVALRDRAWPRLSPAERMVAFGDVSAFAQAGEVDVGLELSFVPKLLAERHRVAVNAAVESAWRARRRLEGDKLARLDAWILRTFGPAARALSWQARPRDDIDAERSRAALVSLVAWSGDAPLRKAAVELARSWRTMVSAIRFEALGVAADADAATFKRLLAAAPVEPNPELRIDVLRALSQVTDPARLRAVLALTFDPRIEPREARLLVGAGRTPAQFRLVDAYFREHLEELLARFPDNGNGAITSLALTFLRGCDASRRDDASEFVRQHFGKLTGAERVIARGLEGLDQCIAAQSLLAPRLEAWLARSRG